MKSLWRESWHLQYTCNRCNSINRLRKNTEQNINIKPSHSCDYCIRAKNLDPSRNNAVDAATIFYVHLKDWPR